MRMVEPHSGLLSWWWGHIVGLSLTCWGHMRRLTSEKWSHIGGLSSGWWGHIVGFYQGFGAVRNWANIFFVEPKKVWRTEFVLNWANFCFTNLVRVIHLNCGEALPLLRPAYSYHSHRTHIFYGYSQNTSTFYTKQQQEQLDNKQQQIPKQQIYNS